MVRGAGNDSFHGCGFTNGTIINQTDAGVVQGLVETDSNNDILYYNGPFDGTVFMHSSNCQLHRQLGTGAHTVVTTGALSIEPFALISLSSHRVYHVGTIATIKNQVSYGYLRVCETFDFDGPTQIAGIGLNRLIYIKDGVTTTQTLTGVELPNSGMKIRVSCSAPNYEYSQEWRITGSPNYPTIGHDITKIADMFSYDVAAYGPPIVSFSGSELTITNAAATVTIRVVILPHYTI